MSRTPRLRLGPGAKRKTTMHYNRKPFIGYDRDPWQSLFINIDNDDLSSHRPHPIVNICGSTAIHRHEITFLTGTSHCRAHAMAKMITAAILNGSYPYAESLQVARQLQDGQSLPDDGGDDSQLSPSPGKVLWIDTVHSFYTVCGFIDDLKRNFSVTNLNFRLMCLDDIGTFNERDEMVHNHIINAIRDFEPTLVVIDDLDHLTPECGMFRADNFYLAMRETLDHYDISLLCVGYNLIGRAKSTAGYIGRQLFSIANNVFRLTNRGTTALVQRVKGITNDDQFEFAFTINDQNFPQEVIMTPDNASVEARFAEETTVRDIFTAVIPKDTALSPDELITRLNKRHEDMNRLNRNRHLIANALARGILNRNNEGKYDINSDYYSALNPSEDTDLLDSYIRNLKKASKIPLIPSKTDLNQLTFINSPARPSSKSRPSNSSS